MKRQWVKFPWDRLLGKQNIQAKGQNIRKVMGGEGRAKYKKKYSRKGKLNEKKIHAPQLILKNIHAMA